MSQSFVKLPSKLIFHPDISALELRVLSVLIFWSGLNTKEGGHIKYGAEKLGKQIGVGRIACRKALLTLQSLKLIKINHRGNLANESFGLSNDIELTVDDGVKFLENGGSPEEGNLYKNDTGYLYLNNTGEQYQNDTGVYLNDTGVYLNDTGHIDDRFKININLNKIRARERTHNAPADVTAGRSMPTSGSAGSASKAEAEGSQLDIEDLCLWQAFKSEFPQRSPWFQLVRAQHRLIMRGIGKMGDDMLCRAWPEVLSWFSGRGFKIEKAAQNQRFYSEIVIKEAV